MVTFLYGDHFILVLLNFLSHCAHIMPVFSEVPSVSFSTAPFGNACTGLMQLCRPHFNSTKATSSQTQALLKLPNHMPLCVLRLGHSADSPLLCLSISVLRATLQPQLIPAGPQTAPGCPHVPGHVTSEGPSPLLLASSENNQSNLSPVLPGKLRPAAHISLPRPGCTSGTGSRTQDRCYLDISPSLFQI